MRFIVKKHAGSDYKTDSKSFLWLSCPSCSLFFLLFFSLPFLFSSCARMGSPDGGWYDETPPRVVGASPREGEVGVRTKKILIHFDEYIQIANPSEKVIVSPPQIEQPEIKAAGKDIEIKLVDSLKANTTYTVDFSDAISDNNEGNPMGNYTYTFSTGETIDSMEVSGIVLQADNLEPVKGILVGLYSNLDDSAFTASPMLRVARTDSRGRFIVRGIAPGSYRVYALQDADGDYRYTQKSEMVAFSRDTIRPLAFADIRQDTLWRDSLHIENILRVPYTHYVPDNIVLRAWKSVITDRYLVKTERKDADRFTFYFSYGSDRLPLIEGLNFDSRNAFFVEASEKRDTVTYWLRDTALVNQDTLRLVATYEMTDTLGQLVEHADTLEMLAKLPYARRMKLQQKAYEKWKDEQEKNRKRGRPYDSIMPPVRLSYEVKVENQITPEQNIRFDFATPLSAADTSLIHLYSKIDTLWYRSPFKFVALTDSNETCLRQRQLSGLDRSFVPMRRYALIGEWRPGTEYSLEIDSAAFTDLYGKVSVKRKTGFRVGALDDYGTLLMTLLGLPGKQLIVQLLNGSDGVVRQVTTTNGLAEFYYLAAGTYYMRVIVDENENGIWDTGDYAAGRQPEAVYYYPDRIECRAKWDVTLTWSPTAKRLDAQKPAAITKQKPDKEKKVRQRNADRAQRMGIEYIPK